jgi:hypothetical protein
VSVVLVVSWLAFLALVAYRVHRRSGWASGHQTSNRSSPVAEPVYLPDIGPFDPELGIYFDAELGYTDVVIPETVPREWVNTYGAGNGGKPAARDTLPPGGQPE